MKTSRFLIVMILYPKYAFKWYHIEIDVKTAYKIILKNLDDNPIKIYHDISPDLSQWKWPLKTLDSRNILLNTISRCSPADIENFNWRPYKNKFYRYNAAVTIQRCYRRYLLSKNYNTIPTLTRINLYNKILDSC